MTEPRRQRGVLVFLTPFLLVVLAVIVTLAMDAARIYAVRGDMQRVVNAAATAAADEAQACGVGDLGRMRARALAAARRLGFEGDDSELEVMAGVLSPSSDNPDQLRFTATPPAQSNATVVRYSRREPVSSLLPTSLVAPIELSVNAAARKELYAALSANASAATVHEGLLGNLLGAVLGQSNYSLDPTDLASLESTLLGVGDLLDVLGLDDVTDLLDEPLIDVLDGVVDLLGGVTTPLGALVNDLTGAAGLSGLDASAVLSIAGDPSAAKNAEFPLYDFVMSVVLNSASALGQGAGLLSLTVDPSQSPALSTLLDNPLLGDLDITLNLKVDNPAPVVIGPARQAASGDWMTEVSATDVSLEALVDLHLSAGFLGDLISALTLTLVQTEILDHIRVPLVVQVGGGRARFIGARCARGDSNTVDLEILAEPTVANVATGTLDSDGSVSREPIHATILKLRLLTQPLVNLCVDADLGLTLPVAGKYQEVVDFPLHCPQAACSGTFTGGGPTWVEGLDVQLENLALDCGQPSLLSGLNVVVDLLTPLIETLLNLVTTVVLQGIVSPLLSILGVDLAGLEVTVVGVDQLGSQLIENVQL
ncbi:hypothetical protein BTO32_00750 [Marinobacter lutaoensis]|uniref:Uncharacterized protein n=1 Tax=Marinobacter lutaoensis TaxID=135739 RepID=A0A1V2DXM7_9GAMM|nr:hypothetical protein [Marinobacter lutaoensis]ONF45041.1 hypothetical protein BTO32_00750 [Marinobacter lutaoensis]